LSITIREICIEPDQKVIPITYAADRAVIRKSGKLVGINLKPQDLKIVS
jgi:hypothetical protein